ncbi:MAG: hypothetical protein ACI86C_000841 [Candidatus Latescibacterota bacterium]|jgi:hypothetical protein
MKMYSFLLFFLPCVVFAQYDFDSRYFTMDASSLPEVGPVNDFTKAVSFTSKFSLDAAPTIVNKNVPSFKLTTQNYRTTVDMATAVTQLTRFVNTGAKEVTPIQAKNYGFTGYSGYNADRSSGVKNTVYKEQKGLNLLAPCPPFGICPRCAHYKVARGY